MSAAVLIDRFAKVMIHSATAHGYAYSTICEAANFPIETVDSGDRYYGPQSLAYISRQVKVVMQDEFCGLTPSRCKLGSYALMCELALSGHTLGAALDKAFRFYSLVSDDIRFTLHNHGSVTSIDIDLARPEIDKDNFLYEWWLLVWRGFSSWLIGEKMPLLSIEFAHAPAVSPDEYTKAFTRACQFQQPRVRLSFDQRLLDKPVVRAVADLDTYLTPSSLDLISLPGTDRSLKARVKNQMKQYFVESQSFPSMEEIAVQYHMCSQTLRRRLEDESSSYRLVKEEIRREVVMKWLSNQTIPIGEVSRMGGFAESNGLTRAVKAWIGMCPTEYRSSIIASAQH